MGAAYPYKEAKLIHYDYSPTKPWYIDFSAYDVQAGKLRRRRLKEINKITDIKKRRVYAERLVDDINDCLKSGYHIDKKKSQEERSAVEHKQHSKYMTLVGVLEAVLSVKKSDLKPLSYKKYTSTVRVFKAWVESVGMAYAGANMVDKGVAHAFADYLVMEREIVGKTVNAYTSNLKSMGNAAVERGWLRENIFAGVKKRREVLTRKNLAYSSEQIAAVKQDLLQHKPQLWYFCAFVFYTFMRPIEIRTLRVKHVDLERRLIYLHATAGKTNLERWVEISDGLLDVLKELVPDWKDKEAFLFSHPQNGKHVAIKDDYFTEAFQSCRDRLGIEKCHTIYSFKHSGNIAAYKAGVGIYALMRQNGHTNIDTTQNYLKSLGLLIDREFTNKFNAIRL